MSIPYFISDLHWGHRSITKYRTLPLCSTEMEQRMLVYNNIVNKVTKKDVLYILGDVAFSEDGLELIATINCRKKLILGNHDEFDLSTYQKYFDEIHSFKKYGKYFWLSHAPIHPAELRGRINVHGHVHKQSIEKNGALDPRYVNVCVEAINATPISLDELLDLTLDQRLLPK